MSEPEQCIICLDPLPRPSPVNGTATEAASSTTAGAEAVGEDSGHLDIVAALDGCEHIIHDSCIRSWAQKTNTCPICRNPFHTVRVYNGADGTAISTYDVEDKKQVAEFDVQQWQAQNPDPDEDDGNNPCPICNSAEREDILLLCDSCDAAYHTHCIGLDYIPEGDWYCMECVHLFDLTDEHEGSVAGTQSPRPQSVRRPNPRDVRGFHVRTRARLRRARRQARNAEWQGAWGQFSGRFFEMSDLDLDNHDDDEDLEQYRLFQQNDQRELQRWQQRVNIAQRLGARDEFANNIPPQISERLQPAPQPVEETREERRAWGAFDRAREVDSPNANGVRKRKTRSVTASPAEPSVQQEPERRLKRPRTRRLPTQGEASTSVPSPAAAAGPSTVRPTNGLPLRGGLGRIETETPLVSSLLKELEPNAMSEDEAAALTPTWRQPPEASSPVISPSPSNHNSPRALSLTPPPLPRTNGRETSPTLSLSTHIEPRYPPANYSPNRPTSDHSDSETRPGRAEIRPLVLRQPRPRRPHRVQPRRQETSPTRLAMTHEEKRSINDIVKTALRPHWRAQKLTTEQYEMINRAISRKLYDEVKDASSLDGESRRSWEKRASQEVAQAVAELQA
ncbi:PHD and RING finger domain-containing protein [Tolypocladium ophioglossoides CBS 100239]|uniref:PHD and RING finger domain-containing protein n=1 Tax=Tolypocladium ophioglossoides (strain CBS 100239) TaxID=1163406 RepID=A0A0L0NM04_TOLOC|nr:PHD and RING finger domain-containing protein [Tolypocladium ophioglossoides CBS 100239]